MKSPQLKLEESYLKEITEGKGPSIVKVTKKTKRSQQTGSSAMRLAQRTNDPLWLKYKRYNDLRKEIKKKIMIKYGARARTYARKSIG